MRISTERSLAVLAGCGFVVRMICCIMVLTAAGILLGHGWHRAATSEASILTQLEVGVPKLEGGASMKRMVLRKDSAQDDSENENALAGVGSHKTRDNVMTSGMHTLEVYMKFVDASTVFQTKF